MRIMSRLLWQQLMQNITLNNSKESSYKYTINRSRPKDSRRSVVQLTINANTVLKCNRLFMFVYDLFDNLSSNILGRDILKFVRISACIKSRISAK